MSVVQNIPRGSPLGLKIAIPIVFIIAVDVCLVGLLFGGYKLAEGARHRQSSVLNTLDHDYHDVTVPRRTDLLTGETLGGRLLLHLLGNARDAELLIEIVSAT